MFIRHILRQLYVRLQGAVSTNAKRILSAFSLILPYDEEAKVTLFASQAIMASY